MEYSNIASIDWAISEMNLADMPKAQALKILAKYIVSDGLPLYFEEPVVGTDSTGGYEIIKDEEGDISGALIANGNSETHTGRKLVLDVGFWSDGGRYSFTVNQYKFGKKNYYTTEETGMWLVPVSLVLDAAYLIKEEVFKFKENEFCVPISSAKIKATVAGSEPGVRKALALLAREKAISSRGFRKGSSVNASEFKKHIIKLAIRYGQTDGLLKSIDEKINETLNTLELKEIESMELQENNPNS